MAVSASLGQVGNSKEQVASFPANHGAKTFRMEAAFNGRRHVNDMGQVKLRLCLFSPDSAVKPNPLKARCNPGAAKASDSEFSKSFCIFVKPLR